MYKMQISLWSAFPPKNVGNLIDEKHVVRAHTLAEILGEQIGRPMYDLFLLFGIKCPLGGTCR